MYMKILAIIMFFANAARAGETHVFGFGGMNTFQDPMMIADTDAQDAKNVLTDEGDLRTLYGNTLYTVLASSDVQFQREFVTSSGGRVLFVKAGDVLYGSDSTGALSRLVTFAAGAPLDMVTAFNKAYFTDGTAYPFWSVGTATAAVTGMPACKYTELYQTRLACVNTTTETSKVALSTYNNPDNWTTTASKDSAALKYYKKDDGYGINCVFTTPVGLFIGKDRAVGMLKGSDNESFYWKDISLDVGCVDDQSVQIVDGELVWLSKSGYYSWNFYDPPKLISGKIKPLTDKILKSSSLDTIWSVNTQESWSAGTGLGWDYTISPGSIKSKTYNSGALTFGANSYTRAYRNIGFELGTSAGWTPVFTTRHASVGGYEYGLYEYGNSSYAFNFNGYPIYPYCQTTWTSTITVVNASDGAVLDRKTYGPGCGTYDFNFGTISGSGNIKVVITDSAGINHESDPFDRIYGVKGHYTGGNTLIEEVPQYQSYWDVYFFEYFDFIETATSTTTAVSSVYDSGLITPEYHANILGGNSTINFYSSDSSTTGFTSSEIAIGGSIPSGSDKRYYKYSVNYQSGVDVSSFTSMTVSVLSTSTYNSQVKFMSSTVSNQKTFSAIYTGTPSFYIRAATYPFAYNSASPDYVAQTPNALVSVSTSGYIQFKIDGGITTSTMSVGVNLVSINYTVGRNAPRVASVVSDHRYICAVSTYSETANDLVLIWQRNKEWVYSDQSYSSLGLYNNQPMGGSGFKLWYIMDPLAKSFDGTTINSTWVSKDFYWGTLADKVINRFWVSADDNGVSNLGLAWQKNRNGTWVSKYTALNASTFVMREVEGLFDTKAVGRQFRFRVSAGELNKGFKLKMFSIYYDVNPLIK